MFYCVYVFLLCKEFVEVFVGTWILVFCKWVELWNPKNWILITHRPTYLEHQKTRTRTSSTLTYPKLPTLTTIKIYNYSKTLGQILRFHTQSLKFILPVFKKFMIHDLLWLYDFWNESWFQMWFFKFWKTWGHVFVKLSYFKFYFIVFISKI